jgi:hypothetical protein
MAADAPGCQARIPLGAAEFTRCGETIGVDTWVDLTGATRAACLEPGHFEDVLEEQRTAEAQMRAARDHEEDYEGWTSREELLTVRPEMARYLR